MSRRIHIAGFPIKVGTKGRQLCGWCGAVLFNVDHALELVAPNADGSPGRGSTPWTPGALVRVEGNLSVVVPHVDGDDLPADCCAPDARLPRPTPSPVTVAR